MLRVITDCGEHRGRRARFAQAAWARLTVKQRCAAIGRLRLQIVARIDQIVETIVDETGKPPLDALTGDILVTLEQMRFYEKHAPRILRERKVGKPAFLFPQSRFKELFEPHGVVLVIAPYNYPFQLAVVPLISALIAGNAVLLKCSEKAPAVAVLIEQLCTLADLPSGLVQVSWDPPEHVEGLYAAAPDFIFATGSTGTGRAIAARAARQLIPTALELGGKDAALVFSDCDLERTAEAIAFGAFSNAGQVCVGIKRLYVEQSIYDAFLSRLLQKVSALRIGKTLDCDLGAIPEGQRQRFQQQVADAVRCGAELLWPPKNDLDGVHPILLGHVPQDAALLTAESFGPVLCIAPFHTQAEAIQLANSGPYALSASIWTKDISNATQLASQLNAASCLINDVIGPIGNPYASFGGNRSSGYGRYHGPQGLYTFSRIKTIATSAHPSRHQRHWFPFTASTFALLRKLMELRHGPGPLGYIFRLLPAILFAFAFTANAQTQEGHLKLLVKSPKQLQGEIAYLVFSSPRGFPGNKTRAVRDGFARADASGTQAVIDIGPLAPGRYAVSVYEDVNGNRRLDTGIFGIPKEPVGASNNPRPRLGPPRFEECAFWFDHSDQTISIQLVRE